jgi:hypothetical protein
MKIIAVVTQDCSPIECGVCDKIATHIIERDISYVVRIIPVCNDCLMKEKK